MDVKDAIEYINIMIEFAERNKYKYLLYQNPEDADYEIQVLRFAMQALQEKQEHEAKVTSIKKKDKKKQIKCICCKQWKDENEMFKHEDGIGYLCFYCYLDFNIDK